MTDGFELVVVDVFRIASRGVVLTCSIRHGAVRVGDPVEIVFDGRDSRTSTIRAVEMHHQPGQVNLLLARKTNGDVEIGTLIRAIGRPSTEA